MSSKKDRRKARRRAEKKMEEAWEALQGNKNDRAERLSQASIELGFVNPRLWLERAQILAAIGGDKLEEAEEAARHVIAIAPTYAEAFEFLAESVARSGRFDKASEYLQRALELGAEGDLSDRLASYEALVSPALTAEPRTRPRRAPPAVTNRTTRFDWSALSEDLRARGVARIPKLLSAEECHALVDLWTDAENFEHEVDLDDERGRVQYRFLASPAPKIVTELRAEVFARLTVIANEWNELLDRPQRYPEHLEDFLAECRRAGQYRSTPILLRYDAGGFNAPHRDVAGRVVFPFQVAVTLGPATCANGNGGEFVLVDKLAGRRKRECVTPTELGDAVVFCTRERMRSFAGYPGLLPVDHAVRELRTGPRYALGLPFHLHA